MPNWTWNNLLVKGKTEQVKKFIQAVKSKRSPFDFNRLIPMPRPLAATRTGYTTINGKEVSLWKEDKKGNIYEVNERTRKLWMKKYGADNWHSWATKNWGTKWNACDVDREIIYEEDYTLVHYTFDTAWDPPLPIILHVIKNFPDLEISYKGSNYEGGYELTIGGKNGEYTLSEELTYYQFCKEESCHGIATLTEKGEIIEDLSLLCSHLKEKWQAAKQPTTPSESKTQQSLMPE